MKPFILFLFLAVVTTCGIAQPDSKESHNTLTPEEAATGWKLLFDGQSSEGWRRIGKDHFPERGWEVREGELCSNVSEEAALNSGGDIITCEQFGQFELVFEWKMSIAIRG